MKKCRNVVFRPNCLKWDYKFIIFVKISLIAKIQQNIIVYSIASIARFYCLLIWLTCKINVNISPNADIILRTKQPCIFALWHNRLLIFPKLLSKYGKFTAVISLHADGEYLNKFISFYNHQAIRGSSNKGSFKVIKSILASLANGISVVITPDGPRGPRFQINSNITLIAQKAKVPIIPICYSISKAKILKTWDKFIIPLPFSIINVEIGNPIPSGIEDSQKILQAVMWQNMCNLDKKSKLNITY